MKIFFTKAKMKSQSFTKACEYVLNFLKYLKMKREKTDVNIQIIFL